MGAAALHSSTFLSGERWALWLRCTRHFSGHKSLLLPPLLLLPPPLLPLLPLAALPPPLLPP